MTQRDLILWDTTMSQDIWKTKYKAEQDITVADTFRRVAEAVFAHKPEEIRNKLINQAIGFMGDGVIVPAGRILAGAGTGNRVTLMNCYVMGTMQDSLDDIMNTLSETALTMQQGGGTGTDFTPLRPEGALLKRTGSFSSGPLTFMDTWDAMCRTIMSAGHRRGAMMGTMRDHHPDILQFIKAKRQAGRMTNFNVSVLVTDAFMQAVKDDGQWTLYHEIPKKEWSETECLKRRYRVSDYAGTRDVYAYETFPARKLWNEIIQNTFMYAEPGVIFIDRINQTNNLNYCETIGCTNPCGEQPLPPYGACDLGHINLGALVKFAFSHRSSIDYELLHDAVDLMVEFLDSVIDVTNYPLNAQANEMKSKRRIGLGVTGLADMLAMMGFRYGAENAVVLTKKVMSFIANAAYSKSAHLASKYGTFPLWDRSKFNNDFLSRLSPDTRRLVDEKGLRNGVILTIAPTGTTSTFYGNISSGIEPIFAHKQIRKVRQADDTYLPYTEYSYLVRRYAHVNEMSLETAYKEVSENTLHFPTVENLTVRDHIVMQAAVQERIDASISKTINCPKDISFEDFKDVYMQAYNRGCKGCTTYRPSEVRGSVLESADSKPKEQKQEVKGVAEPVSTGPTQPTAAVSVRDEVRKKLGEKRDKILEGRTYKLKWPNLAAAIYITVNHNDYGEPEEVFIASKNSQYAEWSVALSVIISKLLKVTHDPEMIGDELKQINLSMNPAWIDGKFYGSVIQAIGDIIKQHAEEFSEMSRLHEIEEEAKLTVTLKLDQLAANLPPGNYEATIKSVDITQAKAPSGDTCGFCGSMNMVVEEGCKKCNDCGNSKCG